MSFETPAASRYPEIPVSRRYFKILLCGILAALGALVCWPRPAAHRSVPPSSPVFNPVVSVADLPDAQIVPAAAELVEEPAVSVAEAVKAETKEEPAAATKGAKQDPSDKLFSPGIVPRFKVTIDPAGWRSLELNPREFVEATVEVDGKTYERVGVHLKGAAGSFRPVGANPALTLKFNEFVPGQKFHGLRKIHLNNSVQDRSLVNELLAAELFLAAGVPAARATQARVTINRRDLGMYVLKEAFDKRFLRRHFKDDSGSLYDGGFCQDIFQHLENDTHRESNDRSDLDLLVETAQESDLTLRWQRLGEILDLNRFVSFMALEVLLWDWDGYPMKPNNYRVYNDPATNRLVFLPHGMDQLLAQSEGSILPPMGGLVARAIIETPAGKAKYLERLREILATIFVPATLDQRLLEVRERLVSLAAERGAGRSGAVAQYIDLVRARIRERVRSVERQLSQPPARPLVFGASGSVSLARQRWYTEKAVDGVEATEAIDSAGDVQLLVDSHGNRCLGSWRSSALLSRGAYKLRGRVRTEGVVALSDKKGAGAGLRLGGAQAARQNQATGDSDWKWLEHNFEVQADVEEVELVCELRATQGRAWFDRASLAVVRRRRGE